MSTRHSQLLTVTVQWLHRCSVLPMGKELSHRSPTGGRVTRGIPDKWHSRIHYAQYPDMQETFPSSWDKLKRVQANASSCEARVSKSSFFCSDYTSMAITQIWRTHVYAHFLKPMTVAAFIQLTHCRHVQKDSTFLVEVRYCIAHNWTWLHTSAAFQHAGVTLYRRQNCIYITLSSSVEASARSLRVDPGSVPNRERIIMNQLFLQNRTKC